MRGVIADSTCPTSIRKSSSLTSTNTGRAPSERIAEAVGTAVLGTVITSSPAATPAAASAIWIASVPLLTPTPPATPTEAAMARSNASPSGPRMSWPELKTRSTAARICSRNS